MFQPAVKMYVINACKRCKFFCTPSLPYEVYQDMQKAGRFVAGTWMPCNECHKLHNLSVNEQVRKKAEWRKGREDRQYKALLKQIAKAEKELAKTERQLAKARSKLKR